MNQAQLNACQQLQKLYSELITDNQQAVFFKDYVANPSSENFNKCREELNKTEKFVDAYQQEARQLLQEWYGDDCLAEKIEFEPTGRVHVKGDLTLDKRHQYLPSLIRTISGELTFDINCKVKCADFIEETGSLVFDSTEPIHSLARLRRVKKSLIINSVTELTSLPSLEYVGGDLKVGIGGLKILPVLRFVGKDLDIRTSSIQSIPKLEFVGKNLNARLVQTLVNLDSLRSVGSLDGGLDIKGTNVVSLNQLEEVGGFFLAGGLTNMDIRPLERIPRLRKVGKNCTIINCRVSGLPSLVTVDGDFTVRGLETLTDLSSLKTVKGKMDIHGTGLEIIPNLESVYGNLYAAKAARLTSIPKLRLVEGVLNIIGTQIESLNKLKRAGSILAYKLSTLSALPKLEQVDGKMDIRKTGLDFLPFLRLVKGNLILGNLHLSDFREGFPALEQVGNKETTGEIYLYGPLYEQVKSLWDRGEISTYGVTSVFISPEI